jgi:hypothetical protein
MSCAYCNKSIANTEVYWELDCGKHLGHGTHQSIACPVVGCGKAVGTAAQLAPTGQQKTGSAHVSSAELEARARRRAANASRRTEPLSPPQRSAIGSFFGEVLRIAGRVTEASIPDEESGDPYALLRAKVPLETLVAKHGFDITELINDHGVTIADFFENGYTIGEMCNAFGSRMNRAEGMNVLYYLGMTDEFITALPQLSQVETMKSRLGFTPDALVKQLGYSFKPGPRAWTLPQMLDVGLTMPMVMEQGMRTLQEWQELKATARTNDDLRRFGVTPALEAQLKNETALLVAPAPSNPAVKAATAPVRSAGTATAPPFQPLPPPASYAKSRQPNSGVVTFVPPAAGPAPGTRTAPLSSAPKLVERSAPVQTPIFLVLPPGGRK